MCSNNCDCDPIVKGLESGLTFGQPALKPCRKCGSQPFIILDKIHVECKPCFLESCNRKLRSTIGKSKLVSNNAPILIAYSGGPSSCALLDLIWNSVQAQTKREQKFRPSILHIDMQSILTKPDLFKSNIEERCVKLAKLLNHLSDSYSGWPIYWSTIESSFIDEKTHFNKCEPSNPITSNNAMLVNEAAHSKLQQTIEALVDLTDKQQYINDLIGSYINRLASAINESLQTSPFDYVFRASSATQLANNLLVDVILGRGAAIHSAVNICDRRANIPIMRPMRDFSKKEIAFYLRARGIEGDQVEPSSLLSLQPFKSSIQTVTENFLSKLYIDYPSTYSTLLRTGNKMKD